MCETIETGVMSEVDGLMMQMAAKLMRAFWECSDELQEAARDMIEVVESPETDDDERTMALHTLREILTPEVQKASVPLEEVDSLAMKNQPDGAQAFKDVEAEERSFADKLESLMKQRDLRQSELAERAGVSQPAICQMLKRDCRPQQRTVRKLAEALGVEPEELWPGHNGQEA